MVREILLPARLKRLHTTLTHWKHGVSWRCHMVVVAEGRGRCLRIHVIHRVRKLKPVHLVRLPFHLWRTHVCFVSDIRVRHLYLEIHMATHIIIVLSGHVMAMRLSLGLEGGEEIVHLFVFLVVQQGLTGRGRLLLIDEIGQAYSMDAIWIICSQKVKRCTRAKISSAALTAKRQIVVTVGSHHARRQHRQGMLPLATTFLLFHTKGLVGLSVKSTRRCSCSGDDLE